MRRLAWAMAGAGTLLSGCFYPRDRGLEVERRLETLQASHEALSGQVAANQPQIDAKLAEVARALEQLDSASRRSDADIGVRLGKLLEDMAGLTGQLDQMRFQLTQQEQQLQTLQGELQARLTALESPEAQQAREAQRKREELKQLERPTDKRAFLALAEQRAAAGETEVARTLYGEFLQKWPKDPLAAQAQLGLGTLHAREKRCREALYEYQKVVQQHAKSPQAPKALLGSADCFGELKMAAESRLALETVVQEYPKAPEAAEAKKRLAALDKAKKKPAPRKGKR